MRNHRNICLPKGKNNEICKLLILTILLLILTAGFGNAQNAVTPTNWTLKDTSIIKRLIKTAEDVYVSNPDSALIVVQKAYEIADIIQSDEFMATGYGWLAYLYEMKGEYLLALDYNKKALALARKRHLLDSEASLLNNIGALYDNMGLKNLALTYYYRSLLTRIKRGNNLSQIATVLNNIALIFSNQGKIGLALDIYKKSLLLFQITDDKTGIITCMLNLANIFRELKEYENAINYLESCLKLCYELNDKFQMAYIFNALGSVYENMNENEKALNYYYHSLKIRNEIEDKRGIALSNVYIGNLFIKMGKPDKAMHYLKESKPVLEEISDAWGLTVLYLNLGRISLSQNDLNSARNYLYTSMKFAKSLENPIHIKNAAFDLTKVYESDGQWEDAFKTQSIYYTMRDSINNKENVNLIIKNKLQYEFDRKEIESKLEQEKKLEKQRIVRNSILAGLIGIFLFSIFILRQRNRIAKEKKVSEALLLNILPEEIANELKLNGKTEAKDIENVTILFTDFKGFTELTTKLTAKELVKELNFCFEHFDMITGKYNLEKIKTIGDSYMAAGGIPIPSSNSTENVVMAAIEMQEFIVNRKAENDKKGLLAFEMRVGIHSGPIVAGIVGVKKFQYDLWGDTVNIASRMESNGEVGKVNISDTVYEKIKENQRFNFASRGLINVKGKGDLKMWFVGKSHLI